MILSHTVWSNVECLLVKSRGVSREGWASMLGHPYFTLSPFPPSLLALGDIIHLRLVHIRHTPTVARYRTLLPRMIISSRACFACTSGRWSFLETARLHPFPCPTLMAHPLAWRAMSSRVSQI